MPPKRKAPPKWLQFERSVLDNYDTGDQFSVIELAEEQDIDTEQASRLVQYYLKAQRRKHGKTKYILRRKGRTSAAIWTMGARAKDARALIGQFGSDTKHRIKGALKPDMRRVAEINPRAARQINEGLDPLIDGFILMIESVLSSLGQADED